MNKVKRLFLLASFFEKKASKLSVSNDHKLYDSITFIQALIKLPLSIENVNSWSIKNKTILDYNPKIFNIKWSKHSKEDYISAHIEYDSNGNERNYYLSLSPKLPEDIEVKKSFYLQSDGKIPNLFLFIGTNYLNNFKVTKEMAHEKWLIEALQFLFSSSQNEEFLKEAEAFIIENKNKINQFRRYFNGNPSIIGSGADGVVLVLNNFLILKLFKSHYAYESSLKAIERLHKNVESAKTEAMIYDAGTLGSFWDSKIYYYIMEKMIPFENIKTSPIIKSKLEDVIHVLRNKVFKLDLTYLKDILNDPSKADRFDYELKAIVSSLEIYFKNNYEDYYLDIQDYIKISPNNLPLRDSWLSSLIEELVMKVLTNRTDLHLGNIGITGYGELRYFDPAYF